MMTFLGLPVLTEPPNRRDVMRTSYLRTMTRLDTPGGVFVDDDRTLGPQEQMDLVWTALDRSAAQGIRDFLEMTTGRLKPFWVPSWRPDLTLAADYVTPGDSMDVVGVRATQLTGTTALDDRRKHLILVLPADPVLRPFSWSAIDDNGDGTERLTLTSTPDIDVPAAREHMICWLQLMRLDTDEPLTRWFHSDLAEITLPVITVPRETPAP